MELLPFRFSPHFSSLHSFSQDVLESGTTLEMNSGMDLDAEAIRDAENNINTARWAELICPLNLTLAAAYQKNNWEAFI